MGFVDYLSRNPSGHSVLVVSDYEKLIMTSVNHISLLLGFENLPPRYSRSQIRDKFSHQTVCHDSKYCNVIGQSINELTRQKSERKNRIEKAAETLQTLFALSYLSVSENITRVHKTAFHSVKQLIFRITTKLLEKSPTK